MIPIRDDQPCSSFAWVNYFIIAANLAVFGYEISLGLHSRALYEFWARHGVVPHNFELAFSGSAQITISGVFLTILTSMFLHGSVLHLLGNVWVLWIFSDNIEDHLGHAIYPLFYVVCGIVASMAQIYANPGSEIPSVGASGAIAGVMGAYLVRYPQARVQLRVIFSYFANVVWVSAWVVLAIWFGLQLLGTAWMQMLFNQGFKNVGGVAYWEHVGGFVLGMVLIKILPGQTEYSHGGWYTKEGKEVLPKR
jgi:membrane associated rhomboid family serine protease